MRCGSSGHLKRSCTNTLVEDPVETTLKRFQLCVRCGLPGHVKCDCDTNIRSFSICPTCVWFERPEGYACQHFDLSPVAAHHIAAQLNIPYEGDN
jgi:hypothetical protein